jgi:hypothetical protein
VVCQNAFDVLARGSRNPFASCFSWVFVVIHELLNVLHPGFTIVSRLGLYGNDVNEVVEAVKVVDVSGVKPG